MDVPVLGMIPVIRLTKREGPQPTDAMSRLVSHIDPRSPVAEAYRSLRTNLAFARAAQRLHTIVLTSPGPADGKSTTAANLAITFQEVVAARPGIVRRVPSEAEVAGWIAESKELPKVVEH